MLLGLLGNNKELNKKKNQLNVEHLEDRAVPAANVVLSAGVLTVTGDDAADRIQVSTINNGATIQVQYNTATNRLVTQNFQANAVQRILVNSGNGDDYVANLTGVSATLNAGGGNDYIQGGTGTDVMSGGDGNDTVIDNAGGINTFNGNGGDDYLSSTVAGATMNGGDGNDVLYDIIGNSRFDGGGAFDIVISTAADPIQNGEQNVRFGTTTAQVARVGDVLFINGTANDDNISVSQQANGKFLVNFNGQQTLIDGGGLRSIAVLGGAGNDIITNNTNLFMVAYGGDGNDILSGGGAFDFLKGGGGNDTIVVSGGNRDFISGDAGADTLVSNNRNVNDQDTIAADPNDIVQSNGKNIVVGTFLFDFRNA
jgi:Ca2+-binding RTX toxin-like protein